MPLTFFGRIRPIETRDSIYFDLIDTETGASLNRFMKTLYERNMGDVRITVESVPIGFNECAIGVTVYLYDQDGNLLIAEMED